jgi:hypothetical protein
VQAMQADLAASLLLALDAFYLDHRECGRLRSAVDDRPGGSIVLMCSCGAAMVQPVDEP